MARSKRTRPLRVLLFAGMMAFGLLGPAPADEEPTGQPERVPAALISLSGVIDAALVNSVTRRAHEAVEDGAKIVIFHITSNGGMLDSGLNLSRDIERIGRRGALTVAFVDGKAYSAAAIAAVSCQEIVMSQEASVGACTPYAAIPLVGPQPMEEPVRAKMEGVIIERMESLAEKHGYPPALLKAMVKMQTVVIEIKNKKTDELKYIEEEDLFKYSGDWQKNDIVVSADEVLTVGGPKAKRYGIARELVDRLDDLYDLYPIQGALVSYPVTWNEQAVQHLNNMYLKGLLVLIGLLGIYIEMNTPGFGVAGTIGLVAFGILFTLSFLAGQPDWLPPVLFVVGAALLSIELFVTPGFGIVGGIGFLLLLGSMVLALSSFKGLPKRDFEWSQFYQALVVTVGVLAVFAVAAWGLAQFLPHVPILGRLVLAPSVVSDGSSRAAAAAQEAEARLGDLGQTTSTLRPAGKARFGDRLADVVTEGDFLPPGRKVRVMEVRGNRIVVEPAEEESAGPTDT